MGFSAFRPLQLETLWSLYSKNKDAKSTCLIVPTGSGKTVVYILLALLSGKVVVVFSPLISLMQDQIRAINEFKTNLRCRAYIRGVTTEEEVKEMKDGQVDIMLLPPECIPGWLNCLQILARARKLGFGVVDEAHCIILWSYIDSFILYCFV